jgi:hypothetical protein
MAANQQYLISGNDLTLFLNSGSTVQPLGFATTSKLSISMSQKSISSRESGDWDEFVAGKFSYSVSSDALLAYASTGTTVSGDEVAGLMIKKCPICWNFAVKCGTSPSWTVDATKKKFSGCGYITQFDANSTDQETANFSVTIQGSGAISIA